MLRLQAIALVAAMGMFVSAPLSQADAKGSSGQTVAKHKHGHKSRKGKKKHSAAPASAPSAPSAEPPPAGM